jgi:hypothetical protein
MVCVLPIYTWESISTGRGLGILLAAYVLQMTKLYVAGVVAGPENATTRAIEWHTFSEWDIGYGVNGVIDTCIGDWVTFYWDKPVHTLWYVPVPNPFDTAGGCLWSD